MKDLKPQDEFRIGVKVRAYNHTLHSALEALGSTRTEQADKLGIKAQKLSNIVCLREYPKEDLRLTFSIVLGVPEDTLFPEQIAGIRITKAPGPIVLSYEEFASVSALEIGAPIRDNPLEPGIDEPIADVLSKLSERDERVLRARFGIGGEEPKTLAEVGRMEGVSQEMIRVIESRGLRTIRAGLWLSHLREYLVPWQEGLEAQPKGRLGVCMCDTSSDYMKRWEKGSPTLSGCGSTIVVASKPVRTCGVTGHYGNCNRVTCTGPWDDYGII